MNEKEILAAYKTGKLSLEEVCQKLIEIQQTQSRSPLSEGQKGLWFLCKAAPANSAFNLPVCFRFLKEVDKEALKQALLFVWDQIPILKTIIKDVDGIPFQIIASSQPLPFTIENAPEDLLSYLKKKVKQPFSLEKGPLMRAHLVTTLPKKEQILLITFHHLIFDGISMINFHSILFKAYEDLRQNKKPTAKAPPNNYFDFVSWEQELLKSAEGQEHLQFWKKQLAAPLPDLTLPIDFSRPAFQTFKGATVSLGLPQNLLESLKGLSSSKNVQLSTLFLAVFQVLLFRYTGQEDLIIGMPFLGRTEEQFRNTIGYFINMLPIRGQVKGLFSTFIKQLQLTIAEALDHGVYPFPALIRDLNLDRGQTNTPVFQAAFVYQNFFNFTQEAADRNIEMMEEIHQEGEFDLSLEIFEKGETAILKLLYNPDLFHASTIERMLKHYVNLIEQITNSPSQSVDQYPLLLPEEQDKLFGEWNSTDRDYPQTKCIHEFFEEKAEQTPDAIAVIWEGKGMTYRELQQKSSRLACLLQEKGVGPEILACICVERSVEMIIGILGILKAGGAYVPIDPNCPPLQLLQIVEDSQAKIILTQPKFKERFEQLEKSGKQIFVLDATKLDSGLPDQYSPSVRADKLAYVIYTSGSTGKPKGVMVEHRSIVNTLCFLEEQYPVAKGDCYLLKTNYIFDVSLSELFGWFFGNGHLVILPPELEKVPKLFMKFIEDNEITHINFVPSLLNAFLNSVGSKQFEGNCPVKYLMVAGEAFPKGLVEKAIQFFNKIPAAVENIYGPTETAIYASWFSCDKNKQPDHVTPIGRPVSNTQIYILDRSMHPMPIGLAGELFVAGRGLARGYWNNPGLTAEKFIDNPFSQGTKLYKTGDLARWLHDGQIEYLGRLDHQVKIRGFRIELGAIESQIGAHPQIVENAVVVKQDGEHKKLVAYYISNQLPADELRAFLHSRLPDYMVPVHLISLSQMPLTATGKVDRKELEKRAIGFDNSDTLPNSEVEKKLLAIWREMLHVEKIGVEDGFFDVGGDSLLAISLIDKINREFSSDLTVTDLFAYPNIKSLSQAIAEQEKAQVIPQLAQNDDQDGMAIIGISCQFPGAKNYREFWNNLKQGKESVRFFNKGELADLGISSRLLDNHHYVPAQSSIEGKDLFDPEFFQISPKDAEMMDPQMRLLLLHSWKAIEDAGYIAKKIPDTAVYMSASNNSYQSLLPQGEAEVLESSDAYIAWVLAQSGTIPTMISHKLGLKGPSFFVHSNCSSSLVGLYNAYQSLKWGEATYALVGASTLHALSNVGYVHQNGLNLSSDGHIKAFDAAADGMIGGEGVAVILLKKASVAIRDGDQIYAILRGIGVNNDGAEKVGYYAPSVQGQSAVIEKVLKQTCIDPETICYVEAHGTGTKLGDPVELSALNLAFRAYTNKTQYCGIGSVKTNIGHLDTAAGLAGCIKIALCLSNHELVPTINYKTPNPKLNLENSPFYILNKNKPLELGPVHRASLSSFGVGGTNVYAIFEQHQRQSKNQSVQGPFAFPLSAKNEERLADYVQELLDFLQNIEGNRDLENIAYTLQCGRQSMEVRALFIAQTLADLKEQLKEFLHGRKRKLDESEELRLAFDWSRGSEVNWESLYPQGKPTKISLPTYPFASKRFWPKPKKKAALLHPMVAGNLAVFTGKEDFIAEHVIQGEVIVPAVVTLEMAIAAVEQKLGKPSACLRLKNVVWVRPILVNQESVQIDISLSSDENQIQYQMYSNAILYTQGTAEFCEPKGEVSLDLAALQKRCGKDKFFSQQFYEGMIGADYGPSYRSVQEVYLGERELLAKLELPQSAKVSEGAYALHPSLMDGALQVAEYLQNIVRFERLSKAGKRFQTAVPFALQEIEVIKPTVSQMWVYVQFSQDNKEDEAVQKVNIDLCDQWGFIHVRIRGFMIRAVGGQNETMLLKPVWKKEEIGQAPLKYGQHVVWLLEIDAGNVAVSDALVHRLDKRPASLEERFQFYCLTLFENIQQILQQRPKEPVLIQVVIPNQNEAQLFAAFAGLLKTAKMESAMLHFQLIEIDSPHALVEKLKGGNGDQQARHFDQRREILSWEEVKDFPINNTLPWKEKGVYLITGGLGGLGQIFAREIAARIKTATIILIGRSSPTKQQNEIYHQVDVTDPIAVEILIKGILKQYGRLDGIIHAAGIIKDNYLHKKTSAEVAEVLAPKVKGLINLDRALRDVPLDFMILFSSISGSLGGAGQADYAVANAFMDAYATYRNQIGRSGRTISINWPLWKEGGMGVDAPTEKMLFQNLGILPMETEKGIEAFYRAWNLGCDQVMVISGQNIKEKLAQPQPVKERNTTFIVADALVEKLKKVVSSEVAKLLKMQLGDLDDRAQMTKYGLESISMIELINILNQKFRLTLTPTIFFEYPTIDDFAHYMAKEFSVQLSSYFPDTLLGDNPEKKEPVSKKISEPLREVPMQAADSIAIIGISGVFPMAKNVDQFWENLFEGKDCISEIPSDRWNWRDYEGDPAKEPNKTKVRWGGFIDSIAEFDPLFFEISPREAALMDPQQRLALIYVWKAIEDAGYCAKSIAGTDTAIFLGTGNTGYGALVSQENRVVEGSAAANMSPSAGPNRISYFLNIHGPSEPIDTACSSSLVAIHHAIQALQEGSCKMAIAGGINTILLPEVYIAFDKAGALSKEGKCKTFSNRADGFAHGEGAGILILKKLKAAERDGDHIYGIIKSSVVNHGGHAASLTTPNPRAQAELIAAAYQKANIDPQTITYIEAHGTGTELGDPVEINGLKMAFKDCGKTSFCGLGSVKTNIGHLSLAAGAASIIKVLLQLKHKTLVKSLHCETLNPYIQVENSPFYILQEQRTWQSLQDEQGREIPRRAGVSSFGIGGVNAHVIIEEYLSKEIHDHQPAQTVLILLSAKNEKQLKAQAYQLMDAIEKKKWKPEDLEAIAFTLQVGRDPMEMRLGMIVSSIEDLLQKLQGYLQGQNSSMDLYEGKVDKNLIQKLLTGEEIEEAIEKWFVRKKYAKLLELWVKGLEIDWKKLYSEQQPRKISLPTYPFSKEKYWVEQKSVKGQSKGNSAMALHPLVHLNTSNIFEQRYSSIFNGEEFFLREHQVKGLPVLPGVAHLEMARVAIENSLDLAADTLLKLKNMVWVRPISLENRNISVNIRISPEESGEVSFEIYHQSEDKMVLHSQGSGFVLSSVDRPKIEIESLKLKCPPSNFDIEEMYNIYETIGFNYGPSFRAIKEIYIGEGEVLAKLSLPLEQSLYGLHPGMMDSALQVSSLLVGTQDKQLLLPFVLEEVEIFGKCCSTMWVYAHIDSGRNIDLCDEAGHVCIRIKGLSFRAIERERQTVTTILEPLLKARAITEKAEYTKRLVILCEIEREKSETPGIETFILDERHLSVEQRFEKYASVLFERIQNLLSSGLTERTLLQLVISSKGEGKLFAGLFGLLKSAALENSNLAVQCVAVENLSQIKEDEGTDEQICYRDGRRLVLEWNAPQQLDPIIPWKEDGVYLITGGAGGLGLIFAKEITAANAFVILVGRSELDDEKKGQLGALGPKVIYRQVDVTDKAGIGHLIQGISEEHGHLDGIIHAAGVIKDHYILHKTQEELRSVLAPKVIGLVNLDEATKNIKLDFFILFSSIAGRMGSAGQADYAMANAFLDAYADYRNELVQAKYRYGKTLSINWPLWKEGGMRVDPQTEKMLLQNKNVVPMASEKGIQAFYRSFGTNQSNLLVVEEAAQKSPAPKGEKKSVQGYKPAHIDKMLDALTKDISILLKIKIEDIDLDKEFQQYGFDSITLTELTNLLNDQYSFKLTPTIFFEHPTLRKFATYLAEQYPSPFEYSPVEKKAPQPRQIKTSRLSSSRAAPVVQSGAMQPIAIIGMSGVFPMAHDLDEFWKNLEEGKDCITEIPEDRWDWKDFYGDPTKEANKTNVKWGGFIDSVAEFDPLFFGISPKEAEIMDPQQRLAMTHAWKAIEDAGYSSESLSDTNTAVFLGIGNTGYSSLIAKSNVEIEGTTAANMSPSVGPNRISYFLNLHGGSEPIDTACSSALVAVHHAVEALQDPRCPMAIAGGINTIVAPEGHIAFDKAGALSKEGRCKTFSDRADGFAVGEGAGIFLLKRLQDAERDQDHIYGVIRSTAVNHGGRASSLTTPNPKAQADLLIAAYTKAGFDPRTVTYIEAHGTGTHLGDPVEINGLKAAFKELYHEPPRANSCGLGSVKTNVGHLSLAAGAASMIKVLLQLKYKKLVKTLHCDRINPYIDLKDSPFFIVQKEQEWKRGVDANGKEYPRRAGVSSFGIGGVNAHVVIEEYIGTAPPHSPVNSNQQVIIVLSAKNEGQLQQQAEQLLLAIQQNRFSETELPHIAYTLQVGRDPMEERLGFLASSLKTVENKLKAFVDKQEQIEDFYRGKLERGTLQKLLGDEEIQDAASKWLERKKYNKLIELWVKGLKIDWSLLYSRDDKMKRISLPTYPFAKERYWVEANSPHIQKVQGSSQHFSLMLMGDEFFLKDHQIKGEKILPAVVYLEWIREKVAFLAVPGRSKIIIQNVAWIQPTVVDRDPIVIAIDFSPMENGQLHFTISASGQEKCQGKVVICDDEKEVYLDLDTYLNQSSRTLLAKECYTLFESLGISYGPRMQGIEKLAIGQEAVLAKLSLPSVLQTERTFGLHPTMMDSALQSIIGTYLNEAQEFSLPFGLEELEIINRCMPQMWAYIKPRARESAKISKIDVDLCDEQGAILVRFKGITSRPLKMNAEIERPVEKNVLLTPVWSVYKAAVYELQSDDRIVWIGRNSDLKKGLQNVRSIEILVQDSIEMIAKKLEVHTPIKQLVWIAPRDDEALQTGSGLIGNQQKGVFLLFRLIKALLLLGYGDRELNWTIITAQTQSVLSDDSVDPTHAAVHGLVGSMAKEYPYWKVRLVDLGADPDPSASDLFKLPPDPEGQPFAYRNQTWYQQKLVPVDFSLSDSPPSYRPGGVYVVIGGAGGIGEVWSEYVIRKYQAHVVWIGRRKSNQEIQDKIERLGALGPSPVYLEADATDKNALQDAYEKIKQLYPQIHGVVHSAIVLMDQSLKKMEEETFKKVLTAKVDVSVRIAQVFYKERLDFVLFFSSMQSFVKAAGQSNYAAGCTFKDSFAHRLAHAWPCSIKVINWGYWGHVGVVSSPEYRERMAAAGIGSIEPAEGMEALEILMRSGLNQMAMIKPLSTLELSEEEEFIQIYSDVKNSFIETLSCLK